MNSHKSNINILSTGWWEAAARAGHGRVRRGGCLLGEGADCHQTEVRSGLGQVWEKGGKTPDQTDP